MTPVPVRLALRTTLSGIRHVRAVRPTAATGLVREVYRQAERDFGMLAPPIALHSPAPETLAASWVLLRETLVARGSASRAAKEAVAAAVSLGNSCPYCVEVHTAMLGGLTGRADAAAAAEGTTAAVRDPELRAVTAWARGTGALPGLSAGTVAELAGVAATFDYLNRMVNVFLGDSPLPPGLPAPARRIAGGMLGRVLRPSGAGPARGASLSLLPSAPPGPSWAGAEEVVAEAFARAGAALDTAGRRALPEAVRATVLGALANWDGRPPGLSRAWVDPLVSGLSGADRPAARLALLTAIASYQVDDGVVGAFRSGQPADRALVECVSWAAMAAALRTGELRAGASGTVATQPPGTAPRP
ncbi:alkylhydroperoxidase [Amycolatopsis antarctica]|uniref:Alkylhydroperoxidase n=1 Tax=Amycolatopsis antarctica TaxID=1854586 RepID=A0A263D376_9PSEU|nr:carboxymuconolactone decarboxylase family protein [Amycolatopsis antarctica]OZM71916.1 alkylhydroperoxidase [Amycolatopsis antarctica]